jgi:hypothetical protein
MAMARKKTGVWKNAAVHQRVEKSARSSRSSVIVRAPLVGVSFAVLT